MCEGRLKRNARERNGISLPDCEEGETDWSNRDESRP